MGTLSIVPSVCVVGPLQAPVVWVPSLVSKASLFGMESHLGAGTRGAKGGWVVQSQFRGPNGPPG